ncbi:acyl-CoA-binding domain-containing protein 6-like [Toxorhynchites rutilus septentrionalis]|uniref:acyl-CoA-binding domain-containing protein 6-like n=1 Tax=Toxorhynchites rutilus septentrionalis TaxID=329112 RepID=UPI002479C4E3|nr:acyl-CoA-binding domain-containing protein 6-like [Toxorhynchites rutilus septentrionalis]
MSDLEADEADLLEEEFTRATKFIERGHDQLEQKELLRFYGFYKQAMVGKCDIPKPGIFNMSGRAKWTAWSELGEMSKEHAMKSYVQHLGKLNPDWDPEGQDDDTFKPQKASWVSVSTFALEEDGSGSEDKSIVDFIKEGDTDNVRNALREDGIDAVINELDDEGLGLIHWAADRGNVEILRLILDVPQVKINLNDSFGQTALHYASSCGNRDCLKLLIDAGADRTVKDDEGDTCGDVAFDAEIKAMLE